MTTVEKPEYKVIGTRPIRPDGVEKVTGRAQYGADIRLPGLIHGRILRSPHAHARILSIDTSEAERHPGVFAVLTATDFAGAEDRMEDLGESAINVKEALDNVLAGEKALYRGHAIAAVAAINPHVCEEALAKIKVEYELLPPVLNVRDAMRDDAPLLDTLPGAEHPVLRMPVGSSWIAAPTAAFLYQFAEWCLHGRPTRVAHFDQPRFAWR